MKNKLNKKGFTLIELLAVIVILAILMVMVTGGVLSIIKSTRTSAFIKSYELIRDNIKTNTILSQNDAGDSIVTCSNSGGTGIEKCADLYGLDKGPDNYEMNVYAVCIKDTGTFSDSSFSCSGDFKLKGYKLTFKGLKQYDDISLTASNTKIKTDSNAVIFTYGTPATNLTKTNTVSSNEIKVYINTDGKVMP